MSGIVINGVLKLRQFQSTAPTGTAPLVVASATVVNNLNADLLDGLHATAFGQLAQANRWTAQQTFDLALLPQANLGPALGSAAARWNNAYVGGINASGNATIAGTLGVTGAITGTLATAAQPNVTSLGTLTALTVSGDASVSGNATILTGLAVGTPTANAYAVINGPMYLRGGIGVNVSDWVLQSGGGSKEFALINNADGGAYVLFFTGAGVNKNNVGIQTTVAPYPLTVNGAARVGQFGANSATPVGKQTVPVAASDLASVIALANAMRTAGINFGLYS